MISARRARRRRRNTVQFHVSVDRAASGYSRKPDKDLAFRPEKSIPHAQAQTLNGSLSVETALLISAFILHS